MNYELLEKFFENVYFCRDGKLRVLLSSNLNGFKQLSSAIDVQNFLLKDEFSKNTFIFSLLNDNILFEKDIEFGEVISCLKPWENELGVLLKRDVKSFFDQINTPKNKNSKISSDTHYIQISTDNFIREEVSKVYDKERPKINNLEHENVKTYFYELEKHRKERKLISSTPTGRLIFNGGTLMASIAPYDPSNLNATSLISGHFNGLKNFKIKFISDEYLIFLSQKNHEENISWLNREEKEPVGNSLEFLQLNNGGMANVSLNDFIRSLFVGASDVYTPFDPRLESIVSELIQNDEVKQKEIEDLSSDSKNILVKEALKVQKMLEIAKKELNNMDIQEFDPEKYINEEADNLYIGSYIISNKRAKK